MLSKLKIGCAIPARLGSTRFPSKILATIHGKTLLEHVVLAAKKIPFFDTVIALVDDPLVYELALSFGISVQMTPKERNNGTERLAYYLEENPSDCDIWVLWQADEPLVAQQTIEDLLCSIDHHSESIWTLKKQITDPKEAALSSVVKVVTNLHNEALYFSRAPIPFSRDQTPVVVYKHVGLYAYRASFFKKYLSMKPTYLEKVEYLEQLRYLYYGEKIIVHPTNTEIHGVDYPEDLEIVASKIRTI